MNTPRNTLWLVVQVIAPHMLAFIGRNIDRNIIMGDSTSKHCIVVVKTVFKELIILPSDDLKAPGHE